jgi:putative transposase
MMESFWAILQLEIFDKRTWKTRAKLANAIYKWIKCWYNPVRRHFGIAMRSPVEHEALHTPSDHDR